MKTNSVSNRNFIVILIVIIIGLLSVAGCGKLNVTPTPQNLSPTYSFKYRSRPYACTFHFSKSVYDFYASLPDNQPFPEYVKQAADHKYLEEMAQELNKNIQYENYTDEEIAAYLLSFVQQCIIYKQLDDSLYPIETLVRGYGDCKHKSLLYAALLETFNIPCILVKVPGHLTVGVGCPCDKTPYCFFHGQNFYYCETTMPNWEIGQIPEQNKNATSEQLLALEQTTSFQRPVFKTRPAVINRTNTGKHSNGSHVPPAVNRSILIQRLKKETQAHMCNCDTMYCGYPQAKE